MAEPTKEASASAAETLQRIAERDDRRTPATVDWALSKILPDHCRFLDGFDSSARYAEGWIAKFTAQCAGRGGQRVVLGYSYRQPGLYFTWPDSWASLERHVQIFHEHLTTCTCDVIPIGFSLGANILLLGTPKLPIDAGVRIPAVILVAPAHGPDAVLLREFRDITRKKRRKYRGRPMPVFELGGKDPYWRDAIRDGYDQLASKQIHIHVVYSEDDTFAAYQPPVLAAEDQPYLHLSTVAPPTRRLPRDAPEAERRGEEVLYHMRVRNADETLREVCSIVEGYFP